MKISLNRLSVVVSVTKRVDKLFVKVLYGREMHEKSIISDHTVQAAWLGCQLASLVVQRTGAGNLSVLKLLF